MKTHNYSKLLGILLSFILVATLMLTSCGQKQSSGDNGSNNSEQNDSDIVDENDQSTEGDDAAQGEADSVVIWVPGDGGNVENWDENVILQAIEKETNTDIKISWIDWGAFSDQLNAVAASNEFPDIACSVDHMAKTMLQMWVDGGIIAPVEGDVASAAPNWVAQYDKNQFLNELKFNDKIYLQPISWGEGNDPNMGLLHVRRDLLDKFQMDPPDTWDQYVQYLKKCVEDGISGIVFSGDQGFPDSNLNVILGGFGLPFRGWVDKGDHYEFWAVQPEVGEALTYFRELNEEKLLDPGIWEMDGDTARTTYVSGNAGSFIFNGGGHIGRIQNDMTLVDPTFKEYLLGALDLGKGHRGYTQEPMYWGCAVIGGGAHNNPIAASRVINYLLSEEGYELTAIGIEDVHFKRNGDQIEWLDARFEDGFPTEALDAGAHPLASGLVSWVPQEWQDFALLYGKDQAFSDWYYSMRENQTKHQIPTYGISATSPKWTEFQATSSDLLSRALTDAVMASSNDETKNIWNSFIEEWKASGGEEASAEMSELLREMYK